jgi:hypothetical protein
MEEAHHTLEAFDEGDELHITVEMSGEKQTLPLTVAWVDTDSTPKAQLNYDGQYYADLHGYKRDNTTNSDVTVIPLQEDDPALTVRSIEVV